MKFFLFIFSAFLITSTGNAQFNVLSGPAPQTETTDTYAQGSFNFIGKKLKQRNQGVILGIQRGRSTAIELGGEAHWRKISLKDPTIVGATANLEYNFGDHMIGYKAGMWMKRGRVNLTYGGNVGYHTDFKGRQIFTAGPAIGFRMLGLHLINGYNFQMGDTEGGKDGSGVNKLYMSLRYYFPLENKFVWDGNRKKQREKAREKKQRLREREKRKEERANGDEKPRKILGIEF